MERNFRNFADEEHTLFNRNENQSPKMTTKLNQERGYAGGLLDKFLINRNIF